ncbi:tripartite tricarboxylate transporter permease [Devosia ginsengisoli]|uniref:Tripartite tricarboxylate transporter permease n=1 Tax=Devosia ginsengisoli TaxID=400770 RepID=A0A5B8LMN1_9HYPH|nr:tripartite tricarboxylate transporter permease [Devosia ginsengisoli]QDZ09527.1 tripartite tricarboxylate transporter permease [Devosia ginsengisoli]
MTDLAHHLLLGFSVVLSVENLMLCLIGCLVGTLIGVLPGIGPLATIAILMPLTYNSEPAGAIIMLAGIYYGSQYGGSTTAILVNMPGESSSVVTALDGHAMARQGKAGKALGIAAIGSFIAGTFATLVLAGIAIPLSKLALSLTAGNYFALMVLGLTLAIVVGGGSLLKAFCALLIGVVMALVGADQITGEPRLTFGTQVLYDGFDIAVVAMGLFGIAEILRNLETPESRPFVGDVVGGLLPNKQDMKASAGAIARGSILGSLVGIVPGNGATLSSFASYALEKRVARHPEEFGKGAIQGVAGPESANNAAAQTTFVPLLTLGLPSTATMALIGGAMTLHGVVPGPQLIQMHPDLFWGVVTSMWLGNLMLVVINLPLIGIWVRLLKVPYHLLFPAIVLICCIGIYSVNSRPTDILMVAAFGAIGYLFYKLKFEPAPLLLGLVLGGMLEDSLHRGLILSRGNLWGFLADPMTLVLLLISVIVVVSALSPSISRRRHVLAEEG